MHGHLHVLEFLWSYTEEATSGDIPSYKKQKVAAVNSCYANARNIVYWDDDIILATAKHGHFDVVRWLYKNTPLDMYGSRRYGLMIKHILRAGDDELVQLLLRPGRCVLDYAGNCPRVEMIEWMLDCGYLRRDVSLAMDAIRDLAKSGRVGLMQQIVGGC
ncbi:hypothetical protein PF005_g21377 [Phytophthora fragariae]|uniref:Ankyrin repeat protein n=1 Tax=Phytophthora fragariae TaxID=53985 RepID=A0A6A4BCD4_9STRA|nr:hypothetical protein PF003_g34880 [Phytophthora fragariae]KAE8927316.1 hypothetical protein PF009_g22516 [Phytophthora fragariae]KAE8985645.1 hypothetical protein PF011_g20306 [Phytophthora fragariae]KAE9063565.1 hypothetical protein PF010_g28943 [Phytophthora fragariae]KAE9064868.1 hypothetical protein PF006_g30584 [Phytophthora fragariae]